jgi:hypothetical protein
MGDGTHTCLFICGTPCSDISNTPQALGQFQLFHNPLKCTSHFEHVSGFMDDQFISLTWPYFNLCRTYYISQIIIFLSYSIFVLEFVQYDLINCKLYSTGFIS